MATDLTPNMPAAKTVTKPAEPAKPAAPKAPTVDELKKYLDMVEAEVNKLKGVNYFNAPLWIARHIRPLRDTLKIGLNDALTKQIQSLKFTAPVKPVVK